MAFTLYLRLFTSLWEEKNTSGNKAAEKTRWAFVALSQQCFLFFSLSLYFNEHKHARFCSCSLLRKCVIAVREKVKKLSLPKIKSLTLPVESQLRLHPPPDAECYRAGL